MHGRKRKNQENGMSSIHHGSSVRWASLVQRPFVREIEKKRERGWLCLRWKHRGEPRGRLEPRQIIYQRSIHASLVHNYLSVPSFNEAVAVLLSAIRTPLARWSTFIFITRTWEKTEAKKSLPTDRNEEGKRKMDDRRCYVAHVIEKELDDSSLYFGFCHTAKW